MVTFERKPARASSPANRDAGSSSGALHDALNRSAAVQAQLDLDAVLNEPVQRQEEDEDEEALVQLKAKDTGLPAEVRSGIESMSGVSLDDVRVHYNSSAPAQLNALAYTQSTDIHVAPGQEQHVAHEAWHVVQQMQGRVRATTSVNGVGVNDQQSLEREADVMGARAASIGQSIERDRAE